jgi:hypothetical protein
MVKLGMDPDLVKALQLHQTGGTVHVLAHSVLYARVELKRKEHHHHQTVVAEYTRCF